MEVYFNYKIKKLKVLNVIVLHWYLQDLEKKENEVSRLSEEIVSYKNKVNDKFQEISNIKQAYNELEVWPNFVLNRSF